MRSGRRQLRSGSAHCAREPAIQVRQCPLRSRAGKEDEEEKEKEKEKEKKEEEEQTLIKSNNPHLAGGEP